MRSLTLVLTILSLGLLAQSVHAQRVPPQNDEAYGEPVKVKLDQNTVREIQAIERDLERVLERMSKLESKRGEFALERVMISKAFDQIVRKLYVFPRPETDDTDADELNNKRTPAAASGNDRLQDGQRNVTNGGKTGSLDPGR